ncbi:MAG: Hemerythrin [Acidimicrobiia bacterium]|nr:Hemerythrin [Acidimicrobiia bacterium]
MRGIAPTPNPGNHRSRPSAPLRFVEATQLLQQLAQSEPGDGRERLLAELGDALTLHMEVEEREVYPLVEEYVGQDQAVEAEGEHDKARAGLARAVEAVGTDAFREAIEALTADISHHVEEEEGEGEIFPQLREKAARDIEALGDPEDVEDEVEDEVAIEDSV